MLCAVAMLLVIFPMFTFPKKLPPRHKKKKRRKKLSLDDLSSDDDVLKEKSNNKSQTVTSSMGFGKDIKGTRKYCDMSKGSADITDDEVHYKWSVSRSCESVLFCAIDALNTDLVMLKYESSWSASILLQHDAE